MDQAASSESRKRFYSFVEQWRNHSLWRFEKELRAFAEREGWSWMPFNDERKFHRWSLVLFQAAARLSHHTERRKQRASAAFELWVYRCHDSSHCPPEHEELDGIVLRPDHPFWSRYLPPNDWQCSCDVSGTCLSSGTKRLGGDPDKPLPPWWQQGKGIQPDFDENTLPSFERVFELLIEGFFD